MSRFDDHKEFVVLNPIRCIVFALLYVEAFLICVCWLPMYLNYLGLGIVLTSLLAIYKTSLRDKFEQQIFDSIRIKKFGVEYRSGVFGESWLRPFNEFRVHCNSQNGILLTAYQVRLKHQVLSNLTLLVTFSRDQAEQKVNALIKRTPLKQVR
ncbi:MAG: hypothetical protein AAGA30_02885 [Planctomycetota bacterium]